MDNNICDTALLVSSCDLYEDAWNPFFRLLQINWKQCPKDIYLITETKDYNDPFFNVKCIKCDKPYWSDRMIYALKQIKSKYIWFFLEDFFIEKEVDQTIIDSAVNSIKADKRIGVIKFIPRIPESWYDKNIIIGDYFSPIPKEKTTRSNLMISLYKKKYFRKLLRKKETPWDFEKFGTYRSRRYNDLILVQNISAPLSFPFNYEIEIGYGIISKRWLKNNKSLFDKYDIKVNFENLGWYDETSKIAVREESTGSLGLSKREKIFLPIKNPKLFFKIISNILKPKIYIITHLRHYF